MSPISRSLRSVPLVLIAFAAINSVSAQSTTSSLASSPSNHWEMLFSTGALVPTGVQRRTLKDAPLSTAQLSYVVASTFVVTTTVGWARSRDLTTDGDPGLSVFTYDMGFEARAPQWRSGEAISFTPFAGIGGGGRSFNHRDRDIDATHALAGYAAVGGELGIGRARLRLEARDNVVDMTPLVGGGARKARNDVSILLGFRWVKNTASSE